MGVANSCAFDDRLRLSYSDLVLALTWVRLPQWVNRVFLAVRRLLPVSRDEQTLPETFGTSRTSHERGLCAGWLRTHSRRY
jgi:hypothetical protein